MSTWPRADSVVAFVRLDHPVWPIVVVVLMSAALGYAPSAAVAAPAFGPPVTVSQPNDVSAQAPSAAYDASATLQVGWSTLRPDPTAVLVTARRPRGGAFAEGPDLAGPTEEELEGPVFAATPAGQIVAAWTATVPTGSNAQVFSAVLDSSGSPVNVIPISGPTDDALEPAIGVGPDGNVAIAWTVDSGLATRVQAVHGVPGGDLMPIRDVSAPAADVDVGEPDVAFSSTGDLQVAFTQFREDGRSSVQVAAQSPGGAFAAARTVSGTADAEEPSIAASPSPSGGLAIAWTASATDASQHVFVGIEATPGAPVGAVEVPGGGQTRGAQLDVDPATSTLTAAWIRSLNGQDAAALVASQTPGGTLDTTPAVVSGTDSVEVLDLAFSAAGDAVLAWQRNRLDPDRSMDVRAAVYDASPLVSPPPPPTDLPTPPPVAPPPVAPPALAPPAASLLLTSYAVDPQCIRYGAPFSGVRRRLSFSFVLSDAATVRLSIQRRLNSGVQRVCPPVRVKGAEGRLGPPTSVDVPSGLGPGSATVGDEGEAVVAAAALRSQAVRSHGVTLTRSLKAGRRRVVLRQAPTTFAPGTYVVTATATAADGRRSESPRVKFWVLASGRTR